MVNTSWNVPRQTYSMALDTKCQESSPGDSEEEEDEEKEEKEDEDEESQEEKEEVKPDCITSDGEYLSSFPALPNQVFNTDQAMLTLIKEFAWDDGYVIVISCSDKDQRKCFKCDRKSQEASVGSKADTKRKGDPRENSKFSRLIGFPFAACAMFHKTTGQWYLKVDASHHNHPDSTNPCSHIENRRLTPAQFSKVKNLSKAGLKPSKILRVMHTTKEEGKSLLATKNTIYVAKRQVKFESLQGISPIFHLKNQIGNSEYSTLFKTDHEGTFKALFFFHHDPLPCYSAYNTIIFANSTYKTHKYKTPLLQLSGMSGNNC
ncbi:uncharacterized protein VP01_4865g1 [Puccinia sorghi]|uniref:FAR1 domain-containing protein n=1 Tax=Puccinia sorghi TaxID=27349 RepID=A0A0L6UMC4_9BASI|nr:uncharacterized protein VP01_4865g1 [Puccinia sorghi]